jgi:hypothetical protein
MNRFRKFLPLVAVLVAAGILGMPAQARASFVLTLQADAGPTTTVTVGADAGPATFTGTIGTFSIFIAFGSSTSPGGPTNSITQEGTIAIVNTGGGTHTLHINASSQGFTSPNSPPPLLVVDTISGTLVSGTLSADFQGFVDATNTLFGKGFAAPLLTIPSMTGSSLSFKADGGPVPGFSPNGATYSMSVFENLTLSGGGSLTLTGGNVQTVATPEPATMVLALSALPFLGVVWSRRRRKQAMPSAL